MHKGHLYRAVRPYSIGLGNQSKPTTISFIQIILTGWFTHYEKTLRKTSAAIDHYNNRIKIAVSKLIYILEDITAEI